MSLSSNGSRARLLTYTVGAIGVVFGDIGTSCLYTMKECFHGKYGVLPTHDNVLGVLSLIFWSLTVVVSLKYLGFIMRADNRGEGGIFALLALIHGGARDGQRRTRPAIVFAALLGAALLYGDGIITPAISVLSAVEGLEVITTEASHVVVPSTCVVLFLLFIVQRRGTGGIGKIFGPVMIIWFGVIGFLGLRMVLVNPAVIRALNPWYAVAFFVTHHFHGLLVLGSVVLCITGGEALYADIGHFGKPAIRVAWFALAFPALLLNYFGQGALLLEHPEMASSPFYALVPRGALHAMVMLATTATVIASQAMISGVFSLTRQAVQLGYCPRVRIVHTSGEQEGQVYLPSVNLAMMLACIGLVLVFRSSSRLASAYGVAVTANMLITSVLFYFVAVKTWRWPVWKGLLVLVLFLFFDGAYCGANLLKFTDGGWFPLAVAMIIVTTMSTWYHGRRELSRQLEATKLSTDLLLQDAERIKAPRVKGTAVFMSSMADAVPPSLMHHFKHNQVFHKQVVFLSIRTMDVPYVPLNEGVELKELGHGFYQLLARSGFMETPNVPAIMKRASELGLRTDPMTTSYYLGRETLLTSGPSKMWHWRKELFALMSRNAQSPTAYFRIPPDRVVELGRQLSF